MYPTFEKGFVQISYKKNKALIYKALMVRETGLEPVRQRHTPLKRACLPIPALSRLRMTLYQMAVTLSTPNFSFFEKIQKAFYHTL